VIVTPSSGSTVGPKDTGSKARHQQQCDHNVGDQSDARPGPPHGAENGRQTEHNRQHPAPTIAPRGHGDGHGRSLECQCDEQPRRVQTRIREVVKGFNPRRLSEWPLVDGARASASADGL